MQLKIFKCVVIQAWCTFFADKLGWERQKRLLQEVMKVIVNLCANSSRKGLLRRLGPRMSESAYSYRYRTAVIFLMVKTCQGREMVSW